MGNAVRYGGIIIVLERSSGAVLAGIALTPAIRMTLDFRNVIFGTVMLKETIVLTISKKLKVNE
jgi:hypothetical protein